MAGADSRGARTGQTGPVLGSFTPFPPPSLIQELGSDIPTIPFLFSEQQPKKGAAVDWDPRKEFVPDPMTVSQGTILS